MSVPVLVSFLIMLCGAFFNLIGFKHGPCVFCNVSRGNGFDVVMEVSPFVLLNLWISFDKGFGTITTF